MSYLSPSIFQQHLIQRRAVYPRPSPAPALVPPSADGGLYCCTVARGTGRRSLLWSRGGCRAEFQPSGTERGLTLLTGFFINM